MLESLQTEELIYQKLTPEEQQQRGILGRLVGICADFIDSTRNGRHYSEQLWEQVFEDPIMKERIENRVCYGELCHPVGREETDMEKVAVCMAEVPKKGSDGKLRAVFDILNTPNGKILKTLCDYGSILGVSSRGSGDTYTDFDGNEEVDPDSYTCQGFDIVLIPAVKSARLKYVTESLNNKKSLKESLQDALDNASDEDKKVMEETIKNLDLDESKEEKEILYVIRDKHGNQLSRPIADDNELWDRVEDKDPYGKKGLRVVVYTESLQDVSNKASENDKKVIKETLNTLSYNFVAKPFNYTIQCDGESTDVNCAVVVIPDGLKIGDTTIDATIHCMSENGEELNFNTVEEAQDWIDNFGSNSTLKVVGSDLCAVPNGFDIEENSTSSFDIESDSSDESVGNNEESLVVEELQNVLQKNKKLEQKIITLNERLSVCYAKESNYEEQVANLKGNISKLSENSNKVQALNARIGNLMEQLNKKDDIISKKEKQIHSLSENMNKQVNAKKALNEEMKNSMRISDELREELNTYKEEIKQLSETIADLKKDIQLNKGTYSKKLEKSNKLVEKYKGVTNNVVNRYIKLQASRLGMSPNEIKNRLPESYSLDDIDNICEDLRDYKLNISKLPFSTMKLNENVTMKAKPSKNELIPDSTSEDDIVDDQLISLLKR